MSTSARFVDSEPLLIYTEACLVLATDRSQPLRLSVDRTPTDETAFAGAKIQAFEEFADTKVSSIARVWCEAGRLGLLHELFGCWTGESVLNRWRWAMKQRPFAVICFAWGFLLALSAAAYAQDPNLGSWRVDLAKSKYNPANLAPKSITVKSSASGNGLNVVVEVVDSAGKPLHYEYTVAYDGRDVPVRGDPGRDATAMKKIDDVTFEQTNKKDGKVTTVSRFVYTRDGKSRTQTTTGVNPQGEKINNTVVWLRQ